MAGQNRAAAAPHARGEYQRSILVSTEHGRGLLRRPEGRFYLALISVYRVGISGGHPALVAKAPEDSAGGAAGGAWLGDRILFVTGGSALLEASAQGGKVTTVLPLAKETWIFITPAHCRRVGEYCLSFTVRRGRPTGSPSWI